MQFEQLFCQVLSKFESICIDWAALERPLLEIRRARHRRTNGRVKKKLAVKKTLMAGSR